MSYRDDFNKTYENEKIPYDDTPISRKNEHKTVANQVFRKPQKTNSPLSIKILIACVAILFVCNVALMGVVIWNINRAVPQINRFETSINVSGLENINEYAYQKAWYNSICVAAGGKVTNYNSFFNGSRSRGSGVIYSKDDESGDIYMITCQHVIAGYESEVYVLFPSYLKPIKATVVGSSSDYDVAVLKTSAQLNLEACTEIELQNSQHASVGEPVFTVGNSVSGGLSITRGVVSKLNYEINVDGKIRREIQTDTSINPGSSGGGLFDAEGKFVGLVNAKLNSISSNGTNMTVEGTAYAIPGLLAYGIATSIIKNSGAASCVSIGADFVHDQNYPISSVQIDGKFVDKYRVLVDSVASGSDASGILRRNDEIVSFTYWSMVDGKQHSVDMINKYCFEDVSFMIVPGSEIEFTIKRSGSSDTQTTVTVTARTSSVQK